MRLGIATFIYQLFCKHKKKTFCRNVYGDEINHLDARSVWYCDSCDKRLLSDKLDYFVKHPKKSIFTWHF